MASETPGGSQRRPRRPDDRSTDKYYASGDKRAIQNQPEQPQPQQPAPRRVARPDDRSTDKYYKEQVPQAPTAQQLAKGLGKVPALQGVAKGERVPMGEPRRRAPDPGASLTIDDPHEINGVLQEVVSRLRSGQTDIVVYVQQGNQALLRRTRAALEMLVTREVITEEQYHDVRLSYTAGAGERAAIDEKLGAPAPRGEAGAEGEGTDEDFLAGEEDDELAMARVGGTREVDTSLDPPETETEPADEDDDNDFLAERQPQGDPPAATNDELDRAVDTDRPVRVVDEEEREMARKIEDEVPRDADKTDEEKVAEVADKNKQTTDPSVPHAGPARGAQADVPVDDPSPGHPAPGERSGDRHRPKPGRRQGRGT